MSTDSHELAEKARKIIKQAINAPAEKQLQGLLDRGIINQRGEVLPPHENGTSRNGDLGSK